MSDIIDSANDLAELLKDAALSNVPKETIAYTGLCHYCENDLPLGMRFCNAECRDEWQKEQDAIERRGMIGGYE